MPYWWEKFRNYNPDIQAKIKVLEELSGSFTPYPNAASVEGKDSSLQVVFFFRLMIFLSTDAVSTAEFFQPFNFLLNIPAFCSLVSPSTYSAGQDVMTHTHRNISQKVCPRHWNTKLTLPN